MDHPETLTDEKVVEALKQLALSIKQTMEKDISEGRIQSEHEVYFRWKVDKFGYSDKGIAVSAAHGGYFVKQAWFRTIIRLQDTIRQNNEYLSALEYLTNSFGESCRTIQGLERFLGKLIHQYLDSKLEEADLHSLIANFLKDLREEPVRCGAEVELQGITLQMERFVPTVGVTLRQPKVEDLEKEFPAYSFWTKQSLPHPSAILNIEFLGRKVNEVQAKVEQAVAILRLFKVGSVRWESYHMHSDSLTDIASGTLTSLKIGEALETYLLTQEDAPKLKKFWQEMTNSLPKSFFKPELAQIDHLTTAYNHYSNALLEGGAFEKRIANSVMGLESLLLKPREIQELAYRLMLRLGKLLTLLGFNPYEVRRVMSDAYRVRNLFAHGSQLSYREKKKLDLRHGSVRNLLLSILDYLRITLITMILINREKEELIDLIEDSLIDRKKEEQLVTAISKAKEIIIE